MSAYDSKYLRTAEVLIEEMSFSRAAKKLGIGQSALSKRIMALHDELGYVLFVKTGRKISITPRGRGVRCPGQAFAGICAACCGVFSRGTR